MSPEQADALNDSLQRAYNMVFRSPDGKIVLADLIAHCFGRRTTFDPNGQTHAFNEGRRDVLLRIEQFMELSLEEIYALRAPRMTIQTGENDQ